MYKLAYFDDQVKLMFSDRNAFWDAELEQELSPVLETLKQCGEVEAEALLGFYPIQMIIEETTRGDKELTKEFIQEIISVVSLGDCGGTTNPRRASSLRALVNWVTRWAGIPIRREGNDGVQLYIPYIYAN